MNNENIKIEDNFLGQEEFDKIQEVLMGSVFAWFYQNTIDFGFEVDDVNKFQFIHMFYSESLPNSEFMRNISPLLRVLNPFSLLRIKANLLTRTPSIVENEFHADIGDLSEERLKQWSTSIFFINTNNGYTKFEDGTKVESVANRMLTFPANVKHAGTSCTDQQTRVIMNFNYFKYHN